MLGTCSKMPAVVTADQRRLIVSKMIEQNMSTVAIATKLNMPISVIRNDRLILSVPHPEEVGKYAPQEPVHKPSPVRPLRMDINERRNAVAKMHARDLSTSEISRSLNIPFTTIWRDLKAMNLTSDTREIELKARRAQVKSMINEGLTLAQIKEALGVTETTIIRDRAALGYGKWSEENEAEVKIRRSKVKKMIEEGKSYKKIAKELGISEMTAGRDAEVLGVYPAKSKVKRKESITKRREAVRNAYKNDQSVSEIAALLNVGQMTVYRDIEFLGLK